MARCSPARGEPDRRLWVRHRLRPAAAALVARGHAFHHRHNGNWELYQGPAALITTDAYRSLSSPQQRLYRWLRHPLMLAPGGFFYLVIKPRLTLLQALAGLVSHAVSSLQHSPRCRWAR